jgi:hypothetical protein
MQKIELTLLIALSSVFFSAGATAQNQPFACQSDASAGLIWDKGRWDVTAFNADKFILVKAGDVLTNASVGKAMQGFPASGIKCEKNYGNQISCRNPVGGFLFFNTATLKGGVTALYGASQSENDTPKDTVSVTAFSCTPF